MRTAVHFLVHWLVLRTCLRDASGLPLSRSGNLKLAGLCTLLEIGLSLFALAGLLWVLSTIRGP